MIDSKTGERIMVLLHEKYGPYIRVSTYADAAALEDVLDDHYYVLYWTKSPGEIAESGGSEYYFGGAADPVKMQKILDEISFE
jgi:hypothetical protein